MVSSLQIYLLMVVARFWPQGAPSIPIFIPAPCLTKIMTCMVCKRSFHPNRLPLRRSKIQLSLGRCWFSVLGPLECFGTQANDTCLPNSALFVRVFRL